MNSATLFHTNWENLRRHGTTLMKLHTVNGIGFMADAVYIIASVRKMFLHEHRQPSEPLRDCG